MSTRWARWRAPDAVLLALLASGCGVLGRPATVPGRYVLAVPTAQYTFLTDFALDSRDLLLADLASLRSRVYTSLDLHPSDRSVPLYIFNDQPAYDHFMATRYPDLPGRRAYFIADLDQRGVYTYRGTRLAADLRHECTHALLHTVLKDVPLWLDEGLAEYFETPDSADGLNPQHVVKLRAALAAGTWTPDLARLEAMVRVRQMEPQDYREAWAWVYFLLHSTPPARAVLLHYLQDLRVTDKPGLLSSRLPTAVQSPESSLAGFIGTVPIPQAVVRTPPPAASPRPARVSTEVRHRPRLWQLVWERVAPASP